MKDKKILEKIRQDYNLISEHFSQTRDKPWKDLKFLFENIPSKAKVLDLGCGNGRFSEFLEKTNYTGIDKSEKLIEEARKRYPETDFKVGDGLDLPFKDNEFDFVVSVAVVHHMPSKETRLQFFKEIKRVLKNDGEARITTWNYLGESKKLYFKNLFQKIIGKLGFRDALIPWHDKDGNVMVKRYYHFFSKKELRSLIEKAGLEGKISKKGEGIGSNIILTLRHADQADI